MITLQHSLVTLFATKDQNIEEFEKELPYVLLPDAIRRYSGPRQYSHFEQGQNGEGHSWMEFPLDIKGMTEESIQKGPRYLLPDIKPCALGERTSVPVFEEHNGFLPNDYFAGVKKHLIQDIIFDKFIRKTIDCSQKLNHEFTFRGEQYDDKGVRKLITDIEEHGMYVLAYMLNQSCGITANQEWFDEHVKKVLDREYPREIADSTYKYMKIPEKMNDWITNGDWSHLNEGPIPMEEYFALYRECALAMPVVDKEKQTRVPKTKRVPDDEIR